MARILRMTAYLLSLLVVGETWGAEAPPPGRYPEYDAPAILDFARHLVEKKEYFRAYTELKRLNSYYPGFIPPERLYAANLYLLYRGNRYADLIGLEHPKSGALSPCIGALFTSDARAASSGFDYPDEPLVRCAAGALSPDLGLMAFKRLYIHALMNRNADRAGALLVAAEKNLGEIIRPAKYRELAVRAGDTLDRTRSPALAALCGIAPGMGYVYAGNTATGILAFAAVTVLGVLTGLSYSTDNKPLAIFIGMGTAFFYGGSMIGGYREAVSYNRFLRGRAAGDLSEALELDRDRDLLYQRYGLPDVGPRR
jgi:hypothetical protein